MGYCELGYCIQEVYVEYDFEHVNNCEDCSYWVSDDDEYEQSSDND